ncbi:MAG: exo-alpha-sialidase [Lentisphaerae bacterium]|jgi:hypothetical protein|nr:exo-alpha-sialidase [Lentisphaerota bacterium]MBT4821255.1 exo-alpha-sialidase [Lentisphaerota bacterium]MBT5606335.1 exo-alpha-sialidase [Lentisphaerota bacterium]MBT7059615.1 exo-alpha-sialidase [Lentisphaerota bacterium]MBT7846271.1 exo-alpha-sialidase [Lentisphaerota bacterium]
MSERYIAVDNVCAWPILTHLPDGTVVATIFNQPTHGGWEGDVECWASGDEGRTWQLRGIPAPHEPTTNRMNVAAGLTHSGDLVVLAAGWSKRNPMGDYSDLHEGVVLPTWVCRSTDGGQTWTQSDGVEPPSTEDERLIPFGDIIRLSDGELGVCIYTWPSPDARDNHLYTSRDDGRTWARRALVRLGNTNDTAPIALRSGRLLAAAERWGKCQWKRAGFGLPCPLPGPTGRPGQGAGREVGRHNPQAGIRGGAVLFRDFVCFCQ